MKLKFFRDDMASIRCDDSWTIFNNLAGADERESTSRRCQSVMVDGSGGWHALIAGNEAAAGGGSACRFGSV
jgi:hypothetical protein